MYQIVTKPPKRFFFLLFSDNVDSVFFATEAVCPSSGLVKPTFIEGGINLDLEGPEGAS